MKNNSIYVKDSLSLRIGICAYVVIVELFQLLWMYALSPISQYYAEALQDPIGLITLLLSLAYTTTFIVWAVFSLEKYWKAYYLSFGIYSIISAIVSLISHYNLLISSSFYDGDADLIFSSMMSTFLITLLTNILPAIFVLLILTEKKAFKYIVITCLTIIVILNIANLFSQIPNIIDPTIGAYFIGNHELEDWEIPYAYMTSAINSIPTHTLALLILTCFIKIKKPVKPMGVPVNAYPYGNPYQPNPYPVSPTPTTAPVISPDVKYCPKCGKQAKREDVFCGECGHTFVQRNTL